MTNVVPKDHISSPVSLSGFRAMIQPTKAGTTVVRMIMQKFITSSMGSLWSEKSIAPVVTVKWLMIRPTTTAMTDRQVYQPTSRNIENANTKPAEKAKPKRVHLITSSPFFMMTPFSWDEHLWEKYHHDFKAILGGSKTFVKKSDVAIILADIIPLTFYIKLGRIRYEDTK